MTAPDDVARYAAQIRVDKIGAAGQKRLGASRAAVIGVGALGSSICHQLVRAGIGSLEIVDRDAVELGNLHRQILYTEDDVARGLSKVAAAAAHLASFNSSVEIDPVEALLDSENVSKLIEGCDVVVDGTDNLAARFLINDACVAAGTPYVYGGVVSTHGMVMPVHPGKGACLRCLFDDLPDDDSLPSTDTYGVFGPAPATIGALEAAAAIRLLIEPFEPPTRLRCIDTWTGQIDSVVVDRNPACRVCGARAT